MGDLKMGLATLVLACVFTGIWISSYLPIGMGQTGWLMKIGHSGVGIGASNGHLEWFDVTEKEQDVTENETVTRTSELQANQVAVRVVKIRVDYNTRWSIPIWSIVVPLTLFSAYLLLSMPHKSKETKITEPTFAEGAS